MGPRRRGGEEELVEHCERALVDMLGGDPTLHTMADMDPDEVRDGPGRPAYLILEKAGIPGQVVAGAVWTVRDRYPWLTVVLIVGSDVPSQKTMAAWRLDDARVLRPCLGPYEELKAHRTIRDVCRMIDSATGGRRA